MSGRRLRSPLLLAALAVLVLALPARGADGRCELDASPPGGPPGTEFVLRGQGGDLERITLRRGDEEPRSVEVGPGVDIFRLVATDADAGRWVVTGHFGGDCRDGAVIRVTLPPTTPSAPGEEVDATPWQTLAVLVGLAGVFLAATGLLAPRFRRRI